MVKSGTTSLHRACTPPVSLFHVVHVARAFGVVILRVGGEGLVHAHIGKIPCSKHDGPGGT